MAQKNSAKQSLISFGVLLLLIGGGLSFASKKIVCLGECLFVTEGDFISGWRGIRLDQNMAKMIETSPPIVLGLGGIFLLAGLVKPDEKSKSDDE